MTGKQFARIQKELGLSNTQMSQLLGKSSQTIFIWKKLPLINPYVAKMLEDLMCLSNAKRAQFLRDKLGTRFAGKRQNVRAVGKLARALMEQHALSRELAFDVAHYQCNIFPPKYSEESKRAAVEKAGPRTPVITQAQLEDMLKLYNERKP